MGGQALAIVAVLILVIIIGVALWLRGGGGQKSTMVNGAALVESLNRCGWAMYALEGCGHCVMQKNDLPGLARVIEFARDGSIRKMTDGVPMVDMKSIAGFPFWRNMNTGETHVGRQDASSLAKMAQC